MAKKPKPETLKVDQNSPAMIRGAIHQILRAAVNLYVWDSVLRNKELPEPTGFMVYPQHMELAGPQQMNGKRVVIRLEVEEV